MFVHTIDLMFQGQPGLIAAYVVEAQEGLAIIECGPASCHEALVAGLAEIHATPQDVKQLFVTHIHLDHSGAAGWWAQQGSQVYVHGAGAAHLIDPSKLVASARRIYGERMETLWGSILPAPAERVTVLKEGDLVPLHTAKLRVWDTPGHALHHLVFSAGHMAFTGDQAGMLYPGTDYLSITSAPPQFDPDAYISSIQRLRDAGLTELYLTHYGQVQQGDAHLAKYQQLLAQRSNQVKALVASGKDTAGIHQQYLQLEHERAMKSGVSEEVWARLELANSTAMCSAGMERWARKG